MNMNTFSERDLPILGVTWHRFPTKKEATAFANWAESFTKHDQYPCDAFITIDDDAPADERFEVRVTNW